VTTAKAEVARSFPPESDAASRPAIVVAVESEAQGRWLGAIDFERAGVRPVFFHLAGQPIAAPGPTQAARATQALSPMRVARATLGGREVALPDFTAIVEGLAAAQPVACFVAESGPLARLVAFAADLAQLPVFYLVTSAEELENFGRHAKPTPDLCLLASEDLLPAAVLDSRYGATLLPAGHPLEGAAARDRIVEAIRSWRAGALPAALPDLTIVVPAYKEEGNVALVCERLLAMIEQSGLNAEILVIDDASPDETYRVARAQMLRSPRIRAFSKPPPRGMGNAIRYGMRYARAPIIAVTMGDGADEVSRIPEMYAKVRHEDFGLAIGSRYRYRRNYQAVPMQYRFWRAWFRLATYVLIGLRMSDYTNGFRVFDQRIFARYGLESGGFEISPEITFKAWFATRRVAEVDVCHLKRASGQSKFSFLRAGPGYGKMLFKAFLNRLTGRWIVLDW
jgi:hypothetical protein